MRLLYAEDERALSEAVTDILTYHKYIVDTAYNGEDAYDYAVAGEYDGIILDIMMPKGTGLRFCQPCGKTDAERRSCFSRQRHRWRSGSRAGCRS